MRMPGVPFVGSPNYSSPVVRPPWGLCLHISEGSFSSAENWAEERASQVSAYFVNGRDGRFVQMVDTDNKAWTQGGGNPYWIGVENEGMVEHPELASLTDPQLDNLAHLYAWMVQVWGVPLQSTDDPHNGRGIGWHGMGAGVWESPGHPSCPGEAIKAQRSEIIRRTLLVLNPVSPPPIIRKAFDMILAPPRQQKFADHAHPAYVDIDVADKAILAHNGAHFTETGLHDPKNNRYAYGLPGVPTGISRTMNTDGTENLDTILVSLEGSDVPAHFHFA